MKIPNWQGYYPEVENESKEIKKAYGYLQERWFNNIKVKLDDNKISYLFYYCYRINDKCLEDHSPDSLRRASQSYQTLLEMYGNDFPKLNYYASLWMMQLSKSIGDNNIEEYWLNYYLDNLSDARRNLNDLGSMLYKNDSTYIPTKYFVDLFPIRSKLSSYGKFFEDEIRQFMEQKLENQFQNTHINYIAEFTSVNNSTATIPTTDNVDYDDIRNYERTERYIFTLDKDKIKKFIRDSENAWRKSNHLPEIGKGWIHESQLYEELKKTFVGFNVEQHARPKFLGQQHYDVYFPQYKIACEYQGDQHFRAISYFGGIDSLKSNQERDQRKRRISKANGVTLIEVMPTYDLESLVKMICDLMGIDVPNIYHLSSDENPSITDLVKYRNKKQNVN